MADFRSPTELSAGLANTYVSVSASVDRKGLTADLGDVPKFNFEILNPSSYRRLGQVRRGSCGENRAVIQHGDKSFKVNQIHTLLVPPSVLEMLLRIEGFHKIQWWFVTMPSGENLD